MDADEEADDPGDHRRSQLLEDAAQGGIGEVLRHHDLEHEDGQHDGEHAVGERHHPVGAAEPPCQGVPVAAPPTAPLGFFFGGTPSSVPSSVVRVVA